MPSNQRHYIHGDQLEGDTSLFYCASCDVFFEESHFFSQDEKCCDHWGKYDRAIKALGSLANRHGESGRPIKAVNVFVRN